MALTEPWQKAEIPGPLKAFLLPKPEVVVAIVKKAKRPILVVGHDAVKEGFSKSKPIDYVINIAKAGKIPIVVTSHIVKEFLDRGFQPTACMPAVDIANRLKDSDWRGLDGKGRYDLLLIIGLPYYMEWLILNGLKHFANDLTTISLDRFYQPNATWSFPNTSLEKWEKNLKIIVNNFGGK